MFFRWPSCTRWPPCAPQHRRGVLPFAPWITASSSGPLLVSKPSLRQAVAVASFQRRRIQAVNATTPLTPPAALTSFNWTQHSALDGSGGVSDGFVSFTSHFFGRCATNCIDSFSTRTRQLGRHPLEEGLRCLELVVHDVAHGICAAQQVLWWAQLDVAGVLGAGQAAQTVAGVVVVCGLPGLVPQPSLDLPGW